MKILPVAMRQCSNTIFIILLMHTLNFAGHVYTVALKHLLNPMGKKISHRLVLIY